MKNTIAIIISIIAFIALIFLYIYLADFNTPSKDDELIDKISKLEQKIDSLNNQKDSIRSVIDSTHIKIITNEEHYKEVVNSIISQPTSADYVFITNYIRQYRSKNDSLNIR